MARRNINDEIVCEHKKECKSFSAWIGDGKCSKCTSCKNNKYRSPDSLKQDYYKPDPIVKFVEAMVGLIFLSFVVWFMYVFLQALR